MTQINEAWRVLSDPGRRAIYDAEIRSGGDSYRSANGGGSSTTNGSSAAPSPGMRSTSQARADRPLADEHSGPARFPWRMMLVVAGIGIAFVIVSAALTDPGQEPVPDNLMEIGSCVDILDNGDAKEVLCTNPNDGVVADLRPVNSICATNTELHRDRQGMGHICVRLNSG